MQIGEIAAPAARDQNLGADPVGVVEEEDPAAALAGGQRAHQSGRACPEHNDIERLGRFRHFGLSLVLSLSRGAGDRTSGIARHVLVTQMR